MSRDVTYRYQAPNTEEPHAVLKKTVAGVANTKLLRQALDADAADFTGGTKILATQGAGPALGTFISCDGNSLAYFHVEYSTATAGAVRQFRVVAKDFNATIGYVFPRGAVFSPLNLGWRSDTTPALAPLETNYYHAESIVVPCLGFKEITLVLLDDLTTPLVSVWACAV